MKTLFSLAFLLPTLLLAQGQPIPPQPGRRMLMPAEAPGQLVTLPDNYQVTLILKDKEGVTSEIAVVAAAPRFVVTVGEQQLDFQGTLSLEEDGMVVVSYSLGWQTAVPTGNNNVQYLSSSVQGVVRVRPGAEPVTIFSSAPRTAALAIAKLPPAKGR